jgi:hypothetical protein
MGGQAISRGTRPLPSRTWITILARAVDIANLKMKQPVDAEGGGVQRGKDGPVQEVGSPVQEVGDDGRVDEIRQSRDSLGAGDLVVEPTLLESVDIKK